MRSTVTDRVAWSVGLSVTLVSPAKWLKRSIWVEDSGGPKEPCIRWGSDPPWEGNFEGAKGRPIVKNRDTLWSSVQKRLNRPRCRLGCGLGLTQVIMC